MRNRFVCSLAALAALVGVAPSRVPPDPPAARILGAALAGTGGYDVVEHLCDRIGARLSGSPQLDAAIRFTADRLAGYGLDRVWTEPASVTHWERGDFDARITAP